MAEEADRISHLQPLFSEHGYHVMGEIGSGSYGRVYTVTSHKYEDVIFAAKVLTLDHQDTVASMFDTEVEILTRLLHPHVVALFDAFRCGNDYFLILEYCLNGTIDAYLHAQKMPLAHILTMFKQITSAIAYCHSQGIAIRDIKPANILIDHYGRPKLADFGLSCIVKPRDIAHLAGSLGFTAPEFFTASGGVNLFSADIWSLGITFYRILIGESPWPRGQNAAQLISAIVSGGPNLPDSLAPPLRELLSRMTTRDPAARPQAEELLLDPLFNEVSVSPSIYHESRNRRSSESQLSVRIARAQTASPQAVGDPIARRFLGGDQFARNPRSFDEGIRRPVFFPPRRKL
jgi:serine/threonine protein kinase